MITLYQPEPCFGLPNVSPYCMKLEGFFRFHGIAFTKRDVLPFQGPYKKSLLSVVLPGWVGFESAGIIHGSGEAANRLPNANKPR